MTGLPAVTVAIPTLNEEATIRRCLEAVLSQTYRGPIEVLVVDGGSADRTLPIVRQWPAVRVLHNPVRIQAGAMNVAIREAAGEILVRVDGHCVLAPDYVERCVEVLRLTRAAMVGGGMHPVGTAWRQRGIAAAMSSRFGAGPARFHAAGAACWVDTVYLGAFRVAAAVAAGGYPEDQATNEDAEFAIRMRALGGIRFDPSIKSEYEPRGRHRDLARQYFKYGAGRAATVRKHPKSVAPRQLAPLLVAAGLASPWRRLVLGAYLTCVVTVAVPKARRDPLVGMSMAAAIPVMHASWVAGFIRTTFSRSFRTRRRASSTATPLSP